AGPTQEPVDPVRFLSNRSSGKMGYAVAEAARDRGAEVVLVSGPTALPAPRGIEILRVRTAEEMQEALAARFDWATVLIMAAAVADFRMKAPSTKKLKKHLTTWSRLELVPTADILDVLAKRRSSQVLVGFAAETENLLPAATDKLVRKGLDLIVANDVGRDGTGFGADHNAAVLLDRHGRTTDVGTLPKRLLADRILDAVGTLRLPGQAGPASNRGGG
ncbi:MAG: phosphopantothenoylcysteine decarboxylase, partial [Nitrospirales bacterium]